MTFDLTEEERAELQARPISPYFTKFTEEQLALRKQIAEKLADDIVSRFEISEELKNIYRKVPIHKFYECDGSPKRIYGAGLQEDGTEMAHTGTAMIMMVNKTIGGTEVKDLRVVEDWSDDHLFKIMSCGAPGVFIDPLGFVLLFE